MAAEPQKMATPIEGRDRRPGRPVGVLNSYPGPTLALYLPKLLRYVSDDTSATQFPRKSLLGSSCISNRVLPQITRDLALPYQESIKVTFGLLPSLLMGSRVTLLHVTRVGLGHLLVVLPTRAGRYVGWRASPSF